jgi:hypothetical protein
MVSKENLSKARAAKDQARANLRGEEVQGSVGIGADGKPAVRTPNDGEALAAEITTPEATAKNIGRISSKDW